MHPSVAALMAQPTQLDRAIAILSPKWALARLRARQAWSYEAARSSRLRAAVTAPISGPESYGMFNERINLMRQVRDLSENFGLWQAIGDKLALYAFGRLRYQQRTEDPNVNREVEDYLRRWFERCEISGRFDLQQLVTIAFKSALYDGDHALMWRRDGRVLKLQGIESDRIGGNVGGVAAENYFQGITVDLETGKPMAYEVFRRTKANVYIDAKQVPAHQMMLLFDPRRVDQYRGITTFAPIINEARDLKEVLLACLVGTKFENYHAAVGYTPTGRPLDNPDDLIESTELNAAGAPITEQELKPGMIQWAPSTAEYQFVKSDRPSGTFQTYVELLVRLQAVALNLPYSFIFQMLGTGPAVRADLQQASRVIRWHRLRVEKMLLNPIVDVALMEGIANGEITYHPQLNRRKWQYAPDVSIDAGRDSSAKIAERNAGLRSSDSIFDEDGEDSHEQEQIIAEEVVRKIARAKEIAEKSGVSIDFVLTMLGTNTPNGFLFKTPETPQQAAQAAETLDTEEEEEEDDDETKKLAVRGVLAEFRTMQRRFRTDLSQRLQK